MFINILFSLGTEAETKVPISNNSSLACLSIYKAMGFIYFMVPQTWLVLLVNTNCDPSISIRFRTLNSILSHPPLLTYLFEGTLYSSHSFFFLAGDPSKTPNSYHNSSAYTSNYFSRLVASSNAISLIFIIS